MKAGKNKTGSALAFSVVLALILLLVGMAFFFISMYFGGAHETKNAIDAGALNVGRKVFDVSVDLGGDANQQFFQDVSDNGQINLRNINRVWSKALLVAVNVDAASQDAGNAGNGANSVNEVFQGAQKISNNLADKLRTQTNLYDYFTEYAQKNSTRMLGAASKIEVLPGDGWQTSLMDRAAESNIELSDNLPPGYGLNQAFVTVCQRNPVPAKAAGKKYLRGYVPMNVLGHNFWQIPFKYEEKPHLVARSSFDNNKLAAKALPQPWPEAVPNAFSVAGKAVNTKQLSEQSTSWVQSNPLKMYMLQIPHGFVKVRLKRNTLQWVANGIPAGSTTYGFISDSKDSPPYPIGCGVMRGTAYVGNEYLPPTLYKAICAVPPVGGNAMDYILQRVKEMNPGYTMGQLTALLNLCPISTSDEEQEFYIYPNKVTGDIVVTPENLTFLPDGLDKSKDPEGSEQLLDSEGPFPFPNFGTEEFDCYGSWTWPTLVTLEGERRWRPGSGFQGGCLGELIIERETTLYLFGVCPCP